MAPDEFDALCNLGLILTQQKKFPQALSLMDEARGQLRPKLAEARDQLQNLRQLLQAENR